MRLRTTADIGTAIRSARLARGWSQDELARRAGVSRRWISEIESGKPNAQIGKILVALNVLDIELHDEIVEELAPTDHQRPVDLDELLEELTGPLND